MKRLAVIAALAVVVGAGLQIVSDDEAEDVRQVAEVAPFPRTTTPLPVPEVSIVHGPWQDDLPSGLSPSAALVVPEGFAQRCTACATTLAPVPD